MVCVSRRSEMYRVCAGSRAAAGSAAGVARDARGRPRRRLPVRLEAGVRAAADRAADGGRRLLPDPHGAPDTVAGLADHGQRRSRE